MASALHAQNSGIKGFVRDAEGGTLPFSTIYVRNLKTGAASNVDGYYEIRLDPGKYDIVYQFIGYETQVRYVEISDGFRELDVQLKSQVILLEEVEIRAGKEDPAYTIMRKAIAKAKFHTQQIDRYTAKVYMKGSGRILDTPFFLRKAVEKEGIDSTMAFTSESVSELSYERPNKVVQKVLAVRSQGEDNDTGPGEIITNSFYEPELGDAVSPLSPKAFAYYSFVYLGSFKDEAHLINKIQMIPRSRGDNVFNGVIYIVEDFWSIHSLELSSSQLGIKFIIKQIYEPIEEVAWLPISHKIDVIGTFFGFEFEYNYLGTLKDYDVTLNPDLKVELTVIDEKIEQEKATRVSAELSGTEKTLSDLANQKEVTRKDLRKLLREYEKEELKESEEPKVVSNVNLISDSTTVYNKDSIYWDAIRPVPLTKYEKKGYIKIDSLLVKDLEKKKEDSIKGVKRGKFRLQDIVLGNTYDLASENKRFQIVSPLGSINYNAVEGYHVQYELRTILKPEENRQLTFGPVLRYAFSREKLVGKLYGRYEFGEGLQKGELRIEGGRYVSQLNADEPIHPLINTFSALILEENYINLYEKDFVQTELRYPLADNFNARINIEVAKRRNLTNQSDHVWFNNDNKVFDANNPLNLELADTSFPTHNATVLGLDFEFSPWRRYLIKNDIKRPIASSSPTFSLLYKKGIDNLFSSDVSYDLLDLGMHYTLNLGIRSKLDLRLNAGKFLNQGGTFVDFKHFLGNRTPFATTDPTKSFRLLNYYLYSTGDQYLIGHIHNQFRRFLVTQLPMLRLLGIKENLFVNYLGTEFSDNYTELGYGVDNLFKFFRVEVITSFIGGKYDDYGIRIGIATNLDNLFN